MIPCSTISFRRSEALDALISIAFITSDRPKIICPGNVSRNFKIWLTVSNAAINLGMLHTDRLLYLDDKETSEFAYKLIEYAILREEVRRAKKKDKTQEKR